MTSMTRTTIGVTGGVDTHGQSHHAAVIDHLGRQLSDREFPSIAGRRSYATAGSGRSGRFGWHDPVPSKPEVRL
jgi:hypothetical protein